MSQAGLGARLVGIGRECVVSRVHAIQIQIFLNYYGSQSKHVNLDPGQLVATPKIKKNVEKRAREKG